MLSLPLDIWETAILAIIYGFSQDGESTFHGSLKYLTEKAKCSRRKVINALQNLVEFGYIRKIETTNNGVKYCEYTSAWGSACGAPVVHGVHGGSAPGAPNNKVDNIYIKEHISKDICKKSPRFVAPSVYDVEAYCQEAGLTAMTAQDFCDYYESCGWKVGRNPMKDWRAAARSWNGRELKRGGARMNAPQQESAIETTLREMRDWDKNAANNPIFQQTWTPER